MRHIIFSIIWLLISSVVMAQESFKTIKTFPAEEAHQAVAVDSNHFYAIASKAIGKYDKETGAFISRWEADKDSGILHLDSGVIVDGKLYAAHSNYPEIPMTSSVEIWDVQSMKHTGTYSFGVQRGSLTWIDRYDGSWWGVFAHYEEFEDQTGKDNRWTTLVQFNEQWQPAQSWIFPEEVLERFGTKSNSGGSWGSDGNLYISGHDRAELYVMKIPEHGSTLELVNIFSVENEGQGIAWDRAEAGSIYTIKRSTRQVVVSKKSNN